MVLNLLLLALPLMGCAPKPGTVVSAAGPTPTALAAVLSYEGAVHPVPAPLVARLEDALSARQLVPTTIDGTEAFSSKRATPHRLDWLAEAAPDSELVVLVETEAEFYSQLNGRFRWTVSVDATVAERDQLSEAVSSSFTVPVFLQFHHEREVEAISEAAPVIERQVGALLDAVLGGIAQ